MQAITGCQRNYIILVLTLLNALNYCDRYSLIAISEKHMKCLFRLSDTQIGMFTMVFYTSYMIVSPIAGYLGDRYNRKNLITAGILIWILSVIVGGQITVNEDDTDEQVKMKWNLLLLTRSIFGIGEACYVCVSCPIIYDLYIKDEDRMSKIVLFSMAIPVGTGISYIISEMVATYFQSWRAAALCYTPFTITVLLIWIFLCPNVPHGYADLRQIRGKKSDLPSAKSALASQNLVETVQETTNSLGEKVYEKLKSQCDIEFESRTLKQTLYALFTSKTFILVTLGYTTVCFVSGAGITYIPTLFQRSEQAQTILEFGEPIQLNETKIVSDNCSSSASETDGSITQIFGMLAMLSGALGGWGGGALSQAWKRRGNVTGETDVCALGVLFGAILLYCSIIFSLESQIIYFGFVFGGLSCINVTWAVVTKIVMSIVHPLDKSMATSIVALISHLCGDTFASVIIGAVSEYIGKIIINMEEFQGYSKDHPFVTYRQIQQSLMSLPIIIAVGALCFFISSNTYSSDQEFVDKLTAPRVEKFDGSEDYKDSGIGGTSCQSSDEIIEFD